MSKTADRKQNISIISKLLIPAMICLIATGLLVYFIVSLGSCSSYFNNEAKQVASELALDNASLVHSTTESVIDDVKKVASQAAGIRGFESFDAKGPGLAEKYSMSCLQFLADGEAEYRYGESVGSSTSEQFAALISSGKVGCSEIFTDLSLGVSCVAVYSPVENNPEIDGVIAYFPVTKMVTADVSDAPLLQYYCVADGDGKVLDSWKSDDFPHDVSNNIYDYMLRVSKDKDVIDSLEHNTKSAMAGSYATIIDGTSYVISTVPVENIGSDCFVMSVFARKDLIEDKYSRYNIFMGTATGLLIISIMFMVLYIIERVKRFSKKTYYEDTDPLLGCNSFSKFLYEAEQILSVNRHSSYATVYFDINKFTFIQEYFDAEASESVLIHVANVLKKMTNQSETYGHVADDKFVMLLHSSNMQELDDRIKLILVLVANCELARQNNFTLSMAAGVCMNDVEKSLTVKDMVDRATIAEKLNKKSTDSNYSVYDSSVNAAYLREAEIESKMEYALKNKEFKVFFQPKYNIEKNLIDSAEALVRWYDPVKKSYVSPDAFVYIFEVNGFISKVDRYIYVSVCEFISESEERGDIVVPISVNVSAVTATKADFLSFYIEQKQKYKLKDGIITLEFTESFAYESFGKIKKIVTTLHQNGIKCSIDDFGSGYSSFNIIKELPVDELKLDRLFLIPGADRQKDDILLRTVIGLGNDFKMKVTQEGIEDMEQLNKVKEYGCDVVQGYYYSKPLPMSDFIGFINNDTSLEGVILSHQVKKSKEKEANRETALV